MSLLIDIRQAAWMSEQELADLLAPRLTGVRIRCGVDDGPLDDVVMVAASRLYPDLVGRLPKLQLVQKLGAGVETMIGAADLPSHVRIARLTGENAADEIAEYCLTYVLAHQRNMAAHNSDAANGLWRQIAPRPRETTVVAVLGLGHIGGRTAQVFGNFGFRTLGWSRTPKSIPGVDCRAGQDELSALLAEADYVCSILPSTPETRGLFSQGAFSKMKPGAVLINVGRGDLIIDADLLAALDKGHLRHAVLDVFREEPLPPDHLFWTHPGVTVTPHVSGWRVDDALLDVAENYHRLMDGRPLLNEVDRDTGY